MPNQLWIVIVLKCKVENAKDVLVNFYDFIKDLKEVKNLHFIIRDRVDDDIVFSFRILCEEKNKQIVKSKVTFKLNNLNLQDNYVVEPSPDNPLYEYQAWPWEETIKERGRERFNIFCNLLRKMNEVVAEMAKQNYFSSAERTEMAHAMSWMLGCTEYFKLSTKCAEVGYYDRINDKYHPYLQQRFNNNPK
jgi:hypothetical protein